MLLDLNKTLIFIQFSASKNKQNKGIPETHSKAADPQTETHTRTHAYGNMYGNGRTEAYTGKTRTETSTRILKHIGSLNFIVDGPLGSLTNRKRKLQGNIRPTVRKRILLITVHNKNQRLIKNRIEALETEKQYYNKNDYK
jgi:hypothetical protein